MMWEEATMKTRLVRSRTDRIIGGVCGGLATALDIEAVWVRLFFVLTAILEGLGLLVYLLLWMLLPEAAPDIERSSPDQVIQANVEDIAQRAREFGRDVRNAFQGSPDWQGSVIVGVTLICLGVVFLLDTLHILEWFSFGRWWPLLLIIAGLMLLIKRARGE